MLSARRNILSCLTKVVLTVTQENEDRNIQKRKGIDRIRAHLNLNITPANMMHTCKQYGMSYPKGIDYDGFDLWLSEYLNELSDTELVVIMRKIGLPVDFGLDEWNGVFIIQSGFDKEISDRLTKALNILKIDDSRIYCSSVEETGTTLGESFVKIIKKSLKEAKLVICVLSENSIKSQYCLQEMGAAMILDKTILPILIGIEPDLMPGFMDNTRYIAADIETEKGAKAFLEMVRKVMNMESNSALIAKGAQRLLLD